MAVICLKHMPPRPNRHSSMPATWFSVSLLAQSTCATFPEASSAWRAVRDRPRCWRGGQEQATAPRPPPAILIVPLSFVAPSPCSSAAELVTIICQYSPEQLLGFSMPSRRVPAGSRTATPRSSSHVSARGTRSATNPGALRVGAFVPPRGCGGYLLCLCHPVSLSIWLAFLATMADITDIPDCGVTHLFAYLVSLSFLFPLLLY